MKIRLACKLIKIEESYSLQLQDCIPPEDVVWDILVMSIVTSISDIFTTCVSDFKILSMAWGSFGVLKVTLGSCAFIRSFIDCNIWKLMLNLSLHSIYWNLFTINNGSVASWNIECIEVCGFTIIVPSSGICRRSSNVFNALERAGSVKLASRFPE